MTVKTASEYRLGRAIEMYRRGFMPARLDNGTYRVPSCTGTGTYTCQLKHDQGQVTHTHCTCPDWRAMNAALQDCFYPLPGMPIWVHPGVSHTDYCPDCKHLKLVMIYEGLIEVEATPFFGIATVPAQAIPVYHET